MIPPQVLFKALVSRLLPAPQQISGPESDKALRTNPYGDLFTNNVYATDHALADEGSYMTACMLPAGAALQNGITASFTSTLASFVLYNSAPPGGVNCLLKFLRLVVTTAGTSGTALQYAIVLDNINRSPTTISTPQGATGPGTAGANTGYRAPVAPSNMNVNSPVNGIPYFTQGTAGATGPMTVPAASPQARTIVGNGMLKGSIPVVNDQYNIQFGSCDRGGSFQAAAALCKIVEHAPPVVIGPGQTALIYLWSPSNITAGNAWGDVSMEWIER